MKKFLDITTKVFLIGLILHFFVYNTITYAFLRSGTLWEIFWLWKEIIVFALFVVLGFLLIKNKKLNNLIKDKVIFRLEIIFILLLLFSFVVTLLKGLGISMFFMAFKYDFIGYFIFFIFYHLHDFFAPKFTEKILLFYGKTIKILLFLALGWYFVIMTKSTFLGHFGYDTKVFEGNIGQRPPAVYYAQENSGYIRNQFLFERPISRGFFLTAFWPLFFVLFLRRKSLKKTWFRWILFGVNVLLTFSRAAWGAWIIEVLILGIIDYRKNIRKYLLYFLLPIILVLGTTVYIGRDQIINRAFSNTGHIKLFLQGVGMFKEQPLVGKGAGYVGPASHRDGGISFNPENQYLQILIEFGIIGFIGWFIIYLYLNFVGLARLKKLENKNEITSQHWLLISMGVGMIGLSISGLVLHSFTDRMIIYPMMAIYGLILAQQGIVEKRQK